MSKAKKKAMSRFEALKAAGSMYCIKVMDIRDVKIPKRTGSKKAK